MNWYQLERIKLSITDCTRLYNIRRLNFFVLNYPSPFFPMITIKTEPDSTTKRIKVRPLSDQTNNLSRIGNTLLDDNEGDGEQEDDTDDERDDDDDEERDE